MGDFVPPPLESEEFTPPPLSSEQPPSFVPPPLEARDPIGPVVDAQVTGYWPANTRMEGGPLDRKGRPLFTIDAYRRGEVPFVTVAGDPEIPYGTPVISPNYPGMEFRVNDTGDRFKGAGLSHFDIARDDAAGANSDENNGRATFSIGNAADLPSFTPPPLESAEQPRVKPSLLDIYAFDTAHNMAESVKGLFELMRPAASTDHERHAVDTIVDGITHHQESRLRNYYGVQPEDQASVQGKIAGAIATVQDIAAGPAIMITKMAGQSYAEHYAKGKQEAIAAGVTDPIQVDEAATHSARMGVALQAPVLAAYAFGGKVAGMAAEKLVGEAAGPIVRGLAGAAASTTANLGVSGTVRAIEGQPFTGDLQQNLTDVLFGGHAGAVEALRPPQIGLADIQVPDQTVAAGTAPREGITPANDVDEGFRSTQVSTTKGGSPQPAAEGGEIHPLRLRAEKEGGFVNADLFSAAADHGRSLYRSGMDFVTWGRKMLDSLGEKIRPHLRKIWDSLTGKNQLPNTGESGGIGKTGRRRRRSRLSVEGIEIPEGDRLNPLRQFVPNAEAEARLNRAVVRDRSVGGPDNARQVLRNKAGQVFAFGKVTVRDWTSRVMRTLTPNELIQARQWYGTLRNLMGAVFGEENADRYALTWLLSQKNESPSGGMRNMMRALDEVRGLPRQKVAGLASKQLIETLRGELPKEGYGAKILDFIDSEMLKSTRTVMGDHPRGGAPAVIDIWANRDVGKIDTPTHEWVRKTFGDEVADKITIDGDGIGESDYEYGSKFYNDLVRELNKSGFDGGNWKPHEAQAVGWITMQKVMGKVPEYPSDIFDKNTLNIPVGLAPGAGSDLAGRGEITHAAAMRVADAAARLTGTKIRKASPQAGSYLGEHEGVLNLHLFGSVESRQDFASLIGHALRQTEVIMSRPLKSGDTQAITLLEHGSNQLADLATAQSFMDEVRQQLPEKMKRMADGFQTVLDNGRPGLKIFKTNWDPKTETVNWTGKWRQNEHAEFAKAVEQIAQQRGLKVQYHVDQHEVVSQRNDWSANPDGQAFRDSLVSRGRAQLAERLGEHPKLRLLPNEVRPPAGAGGNVIQFPPAELAAEAQGLRLKADRNEAAFLNADLLQAAADFGRKIYQRGMDFGSWAADMLHSLGDKIRPHLETLWRSITGENILPHKREAGAAGGTGGSSNLPGQHDLQKASGDREKMRGHIETVKRYVEASPTVKERIASWMTPSVLPEVNARAVARIDREGLMDSYAKFLKQPPEASNDWGAWGRHLAERLDSQGHVDEAIAVHEKMTDGLTGPAQLMQYISTIEKTSATGLVRLAQKKVFDTLLQDPVKSKLLAEIERLQKQLEAIQDPKVRQATAELMLKGLLQVNRPGERMSAARVNELIERNKSGKLTPHEFADELSKNLGVPRLTTENVNRIKRAQQVYADAKARGAAPEVIMQRGAEMMDSVYGLIPPTMWDKVRGAAVISMILHGKLPVRIALSGGINLFGRMLVDTIENIPRDLGNVFKGNRLITTDQLAAVREGLEAPASAYRAGYEDAQVRGLTKGKSFVEGMKTLISLANLTTRGMYELDDIAGKNQHLFSSKFGKLAENTVTVIHNVIPYAYWNAGFNSSLIRRMRVAGVTVPTEEMVANARIDGNKAIFYNETVPYHMLKLIRRSLDLPTNLITKGKYGFGTATIPFAKVPMAILNEGSTWSPIGGIKAILELCRPVVRQEVRGKEVADNLIKAAIGTGSLVMGGYWLASLGIVTGAKDEDKAMDAMMTSLGWGGYKINLSELKRRMLSLDFHSKSELPEDGDWIINYNWAEPVAFPFAYGADLWHSKELRQRQVKKGLIVPDEHFSAALSGVKSLFDNPMVQGLQQLTQNFSSGEWGKLAADVVGNVPGNFIPSLVRQTSQQMDNTVRELRGDGPIAAEVAKLESQLPWLSRKFPPRYDVFGEAVKRQNYGDAQLINTFFNPATVSKFKANPQVRELMKIYEGTASSSSFPKGVERTVMITKPDGQPQEIQLDNTQIAQYQRYVGQLSQAMVVRLMAAPAWAAVTPEQRQNTVTMVLSAVNRAAKIELFGDRPFKEQEGNLMKPYPSISLPDVWGVAAILERKRDHPNLVTRPAAGADY